MTANRCASVEEEGAHSTGGMGKLSTFYRQPFQGLFSEPMGRYREGDVEPSKSFLPSDDRKRLAFRMFNKLIQGQMKVDPLG